MLQGRLLGNQRNRKFQVLPKNSGATKRIGIQQQGWTDRFSRQVTMPPFEVNWDRGQDLETYPTYFWRIFLIPNWTLGQFLFLPIIVHIVLLPSLPRMMFSQITLLCFFQ